MLIYLTFVVMTLYLYLVFVLKLHRASTDSLKNSEIRKRKKSLQFVGVSWGPFLSACMPECEFGCVFAHAKLKAMFFLLQDVINIRANRYE